MNTGTSDAHCGDALSAVINELQAEPRLTAALRHAETLRVTAALGSEPAIDAEQLAAVVRDSDDLSAIAAIHALGAVADSLADTVLLDVVLQGEEPFAGHAAWALGARGSSPEAIIALVDLLAAGGFTAMLAERTLLEWARAGESRPPDAPLRRFMSDPGTDGIVVIQPFLHARIDADGSALGAGDAGGIASLLRSLGSALGRLHSIDEVVTVTRRHADEPRSELLTAHHRVERIDVGTSGNLPWREAWVHRVQIEEALLALGERYAHRRVVWHLRMADVGTLAASAAARRLGQRVVFTAAPDPHIVIDAMQDHGRLDRRRFGVEEAAAQFWFRARMVERLAAHADHLVVLPRPSIMNELVDLIGLDAVDVARRVTVVPEGVDVGEVERAGARLRAGHTSAAVARVIQSLPIERRGLPWIITVGRLHPSKGPQRIVDAVAADPALSERVNVVLVGGDIVSPSADEQSTIELVRRAARDSHVGLVTLTGHLPPAEVSDLVAHVVATGGIYVAASDKEEFGLAIVEALAAGAVVVAPRRGGPSTYVEDGRTGVLCDASTAGELTAAIAAALALVPVAGRAARASAMVRDNLSVERMAERLGGVYRRLVPSKVSA